MLPGIISDASRFSREVLQWREERSTAILRRGGSGSGRLRLAKLGFGAIRRVELYAVVRDFPSAAGARYELRASRSAVHARINSGWSHPKCRAYDILQCSRCSPLPQVAHRSPSLPSLATLRLLRQASSRRKGFSYRLLPISGNSQRWGLGRRASTVSHSREKP